MKFKFKKNSIVYLEQEPNKCFVIYKRVKENNNFYLLKEVINDGVTFQMLKSFLFKFLKKHFGFHTTYKLFKNFFSTKILAKEVYVPPLYISQRYDNLIPEVLLSNHEYDLTTKQCSDESTCEAIQTFLNEA